MKKEIYNDNSISGDSGNVDLGNVDSGNTNFKIENKINKTKRSGNLNNKNTNNKTRNDKTTRSGKLITENNKTTRDGNINNGNINNGNINNGNINNGNIKNRIIRNRNKKNENINKLNLYEKENIIPKPWKLICSGAIVLLIALLVYVGIWVDETFGKIPFAQLLFHLMVPLDGADNNLLLDYIEGAVVTFLILMIVFYLPFIFEWSFFAKKRELKNSQKRMHDSGGIKGKITNTLIVGRKMYMRHILSVTSVVLAGTLIVDLIYFGVPEYIVNQFKVTKIYEKEYVDSATAKITFPEEKKNLIYIVVESLESTFADIENGGALSENLISNLTKLQEDNVHFSNKNDVSGALQVPGTSWTIAGMIAETSGVPMTLPIGQNSYGHYKYFLPGLTSMGQILEREGYNNEIMLGSKSSFSGLDKYYTQHGNYKIFDYYTAIDKGYIDEDYYEFWGVEDCKLLEYAKKELAELSEDEKPFNLMINTIDTHTPTGYTCRLCPKKYDRKYKNAIACVDKQLKDFVNWVKKQDFYEDTVIVITGDHLSMSPRVEEYMEASMDKEEADEYERTTYNVIINSQLEARNTKNRTFCTMDLYPTVLASMGCKIEGDRLGLGTNLFSDRKTLMEEMGTEKFVDELSKNSKYYNKKIVDGD